MKRSVRKFVLVSMVALLPLAALAAAPDPSAAAQASGSSGSGVILALAVPVVAVVFGMLALWWLVRRYAVARSGSGPMRVTQALAVGPRERVVLLEAGGRRLIVGVTPASVTLLTQWDDAAQATPPSAQR